MDNITFGFPFNELRYRDALKYSCLEQDISILVKGDQTIIGEKGLNLSGG
jgi:ATP-binding cassette subfamily C (CFTR/MRP) protein 2